MILRHRYSALCDFVTYRDSSYRSVSLYNFVTFFYRDEGVGYVALLGLVTSFILHLIKVTKGIIIFLHGIL